MGLTREQVASYLASKGLPFTEEGVKAGLLSFNAESPGGQIDPAMIPESQMSFTDAFGKGAELYRTNNPESMFAVRSGPAAPSAYGEGETFFNRPAGPATWQFDQNTGTFTNSADPGRTVSAADLGLGGISGQNVPYALTKLASDTGSLRDEWSQYAIQNHPEWSQDQLIGGLRNDAGEIIRQSAPSGLDNFMGKAIPAAVIATMTAGATGAFDAGGSLANLAGNGATGTGGGLLGTQAAAPVTDATMTAVGGGEAGGGFFGGASATGSGITGATTTGGGITGATTGGTLGVTGTTAATLAGGAFDPTVASIMTATGKSAADAAKLVAIAQSSTSGGPSAVRATLEKMGVPSGVIDALVKLAPAVAGAAISSVGGGGAKEAGTTTTTETKAPWTPMQPYLTGIAGAAKSNYETAKTMTPEQKALLAQAQGMTTAQMNDPVYGQLRTGAADMVRGVSDKFTPAANIAGANAVGSHAVDPNQYSSAGAPMVNAASVDVSKALGSLGKIDPSNAYQSLLSGGVSNPYLQNIASDNFTMANRNLMENIMPGIRSGSQAAGQYGGSRQGIAEGLAMSRMNQDVTAANNSMFGNAYQQAQGNMLSAAGQLGGLGVGAATNNANLNQQAQTVNAGNLLNNNQFNASLSSGIAQNNANRAVTADTTNAANTLGTQQFNANLGLTNNTQKLGQMTAGLDMFNTANNMQNTGIKNALDMSNYGNAYANDALKNYAGIVSPLGGLGQTGTSSTPYYNNPTNNLLGGAVMGSTIYKNIFNTP